MVSAVFIADAGVQRRLRPRHPQQLIGDHTHHTVVMFHRTPVPQHQLDRPSCGDENRRRLKSRIRQGHVDGQVVGQVWGWRVASRDVGAFVVVHLDRGSYRIAVLEMDGRQLLVVSTGSQDESPSFAPNSDSLIYATRQGQNGVLETVSADGLVRSRLAAGQSDVREPVWSPFPRY